MTAPEATALVIRLFGPFEATLNGRPLPHLRTRKGQWLLALLVLRARHPLQRDWLAGTLWPDSSQEGALANLRLSLADLRQALGSEAHHVQSPTPRTLRFEPDGVEVDLLAFDAALQHGDRVALEQALVLYRGPLLEGCTEEWALQEREVREQAYLQACEQAACYALQADDPAEAARHLREVIAVDPLRESAQRGLMQALAASGDYAAVVQVYRELRVLLRQELNTEPAAETAALFEQIRRQGRDRAGTGRQERQECSAASPGGEADSTDLIGSPWSRSGRADNLPPSLTSFIGRAEEKQEVQHLVTSTRLLTLTGSGGCGKTRLALAVAAELLEDFAEGVWLVELAALSDPALVPQSVLKALGVRDEPGRTTTETLCASLRSRHLLLLLDNCEHLVEACAVLADMLHRSCPNLKILATSREALKVEGEQPWRVPPMQHPMNEHLPSDEKELAAILLEYDACRLFVERARVQRPDFVLSGHNVLALVELCQRLDGIPLALELAAARMRSLTIEEMTHRLDQRFRLLTGGRRTAPPRHQTLRALIDWSYDLLTSQEQLLLGRLSVFAGGWTLEATEQVCALQGRDGREEGRGMQVQEPGSAAGALLPLPSSLFPDEVLDLLTSLVDKSLVIYEVYEAQGRYHLLETVREYASEKLAGSGEESAVRMRHLDYFLAFAERTEPELYGPKQLGWLKRLDAEHANFRAALAASLQQTELADQGMRLAAALAWFWYRCAHMHEGMEWLQTFLGRPEAQGATASRGRLLLGAGMLALYLEEKPYSIELLQECTRIYRQLNAPAGVAESLVYQGISCVLIKRPVEAETLLTESVAQWRSVGDAWGRSTALWGLGVALAWGLGRLDEAQTALEESIALFGRIGDFWGIGPPLRILSSVMEQRGDLSRARSLLEQAVDSARTAEDAHYTAYITWELAHICSELEDYETALQCDRESIRMYEQLGLASDFIAVSYIRMGRYYRRQGDRAQSLHHFGKGLEAAREPGTIVAEVELRSLSFSIARWIAEAEQALQEVE